MDIIIRNGIIQNTEKEQKINIKTKKNWNNYNPSIPGPYYDPCQNHICVFRFPHQIKNFNGPQNNFSQKIIITEYLNNQKYCSICHKQYINEYKFLSNKKKFIDDQYYQIKLVPTTNKYKFNNYYKISISYIFKKYIKRRKNANLDEIKLEFFFIFQKRKKIIKNFYNLTYKLIKKPLFYPISSKQNKLIWPMDLSLYQKFKLNNPNYKKSCIFLTETPINKNYIIIE